MEKIKIEVNADELELIVNACLVVFADAVKLHNIKKEKEYHDLIDKLKGIAVSAAAAVVG